MRCTFGLTAVVLVVLGGNGLGQDKKDGLVELQGRWKLVACERGGMPLPKEEVPPGTISFEKDGRTKATLGDQEIEATIKVDATKTPKTMDAAHTKGPHKDDKQFLIYKVEADRLSLCGAAPGASEKERPTTFATKNSDCTLFIFERVK